jgi:pimeloyl-ACP methyl ester carboxylesterase
VSTESSVPHARRLAVHLKVMRRTTSEPRLAFERAGETGPEVLLVMGLGMRGAVWRPQIERLQGDHRLVWFDNRGIGGSDPIAGLPSMRDFAHDALRVADDAGLGGFHVVGVSLGGMIAQEVSLLAPARVRSLTLIATHAGGVGGLVPHPRGFYHFARSFVQRGDGRVDALQRLLYPPRFLRETDRVALAERIASQTGSLADRRAALRQLVAVARHDTRARLREVSVPTLVLKPEEDVLVRPAHADLLASRIPGARLHTVRGAGHGLMFQCADEVADVIRTHVATHEPRS